ncbi:hypothetical protein [Gordonia sp. (in: high G+C Gram-positive bacteria)]|uniref:hypothetical protein n=1 Tax=Gordonia sp. (in: high G+C Gram-positive bacteria) TaxID=84139 RepID=UPI003C70D42E
MSLDAAIREAVMGFGITTENIAEIVAKWRQCGTEIGALSYQAADLSLAGSRSAPALRDAGNAAHGCARSVSTNLSGLADALQAFNARTVESDRAAAAALAALRLQS